MLKVNFQSVCHLHPLTKNDRFILKSLKIIVKLYLASCCAPLLETLVCVKWSNFGNCHADICVPFNYNMLHFYE